jgi:integrase
MIKRVWRKRPIPDWYWVYDIYVGGRRQKTPRGEYFPTKGECEDAVNVILADYRRGRYDFPSDRSRVTVSDLSHAFADQMRERGRAPGHVKRAERVLAAFDNLLPVGAVVADVEIEHLERYYSVRLRDGVKPGTAATEVIAIVTALNCAPSLFKSLARWRPPRKPKHIVAWSGGRDRIITREEESTLIEALMRDSNPVRRQDARIFWLALRTGMREGELLGLLRSSVVFERAIRMEHGWIEVRRSLSTERTKTGKKRVVPMSRSVAQMLREQIASTESQYIFPGKRDRIGKSDSLFVHSKDALRSVQLFLISIERAADEGGLCYGRDKPGGFVFHDTRHTAATRMLHAGADLKTVASILGHTDGYMTMRYAHASAATRQAAIASLEDENFRSRFESAEAPDEAQPSLFRSNAATG